MKEILMNGNANLVRINVALITMMGVFMLGISYFVFMRVILISRSEPTPSRVMTKIAPRWGNISSSQISSF